MKSICREGARRLIQRFLKFERGLIRKIQDLFFCDKSMKQMYLAAFAVADAMQPYLYEKTPVYEKMPETLSASVSGISHPPRRPGTGGVTLCANHRETF